MSLKDNAVSKVRFDRIAHDSSTLCMITMVVEPMKFKAIRAMLYSKVGTPLIKISGQGTKHPSQEADYWYRVPNTLEPDESGYDTYLQKLEYGLTHAALVTRNEKFIRNLTPESVWTKLKSSTYSTPLIQAWMPWLIEQLSEKNLLRECRCYRLNCAILDLKPGSSDLDDLVSEGIRSGKLVIP